MWMDEYYIFYCLSFSNSEQITFNLHTNKYRLRNTNSPNNKIPAHK